MKRLFVPVIFAAVLGVPAVQGQMQIVLQQDQANYTYGNGGEFRASGTVLSANPGLSGYSPDTAGSGYFQTFCIEASEYFTPGVTYDVTIGDRAIYGNQPPNGDPISIGTAWLYSQFAAGNLSGYNYSYGGLRVNSAGDFQQALWWLEGENGGGRNYFIDTAETALYGAGNTGGVYDTYIQGDANGAYNVVALNLWVVDTDAVAQDQLMVIPEPAGVSFGLLLLLPLCVTKVRIMFRKRTA
jgi:hypothetical protein